MPRKRATSQSTYRRCLRCGRVVLSDQPVFLIRSESGLTLGPYHPECATIVVDSARGKGVKGAEMYQQGRLEGEAGREETLPW